MIFAAILIAGLLIGSVVSGQTATACSDGLDNDGDNRADYPNDPGCSSKKDTSELNPKIACDDSIDNDGDGKRDYPADTGCQSLRDSSERGPKACDNGKDDDRDGMIDFPNDPGCVDTLDNDEKNAPITQCNDRLDNDGDGTTDYPNDPGCSSTSDNSEKGTTACDNNYDDDFDSKVDYPADGDCSGPSDTTEYGTCADSDTGIRIYSEGSISGVKDGQSFIYTDYCAGSTSIVEYYCGTYYSPSSKTQTCPIGLNGTMYSTGQCVNGACVREQQSTNSCTDSDFGFDIHSKGTVNGTQSGQSFSYTDYCVDESNLVEYQCYNNGPYSYEYTCQANQTAGPLCVQGACV